MRSGRLAVVLVLCLALLVYVRASFQAHREHFSKHLKDSGDEVAANDDIETDDNGDALTKTAAVQRKAPTEKHVIAAPAAVTKEQTLEVIDDSLSFDLANSGQASGAADITQFGVGQLAKAKRQSQKKGGAAVSADRAHALIDIPVPDSVPTSRSEVHQGVRAADGVTPSTTQASGGTEASQGPAGGPLCGAGAASSGSAAPSTLIAQIGADTLAAIEARTCKGEVILLPVLSSTHLKLAINSHAQLRVQSQENVVVLAGSAAACNTFASAVTTGATCLWLPTTATGNQVSRSDTSSTLAAAWALAFLASEHSINALLLTPATFMAAKWYEFADHESMQGASVIVGAGSAPRAFAGGAFYLRSSRLSSALARAMVFELLEAQANVDPAEALEKALCGLLVPDGVTDRKGACSSAFEATEHAVPDTWGPTASFTFEPATNVTLRSAKAPSSLLSSAASAHVSLPSILVPWLNAAPKAESSGPVVLAPPWLMSTWEFAGAKGWWETTAHHAESGGHATPPRAVLADASRLEPSAAEEVFKVVGWWHAEAGGLQEGAKSQDHGEEEVASQKLLTLLPTSMLWPAAEADLWHLYGDIARLAALTGRVPVWPAFDCTVPWTKRHPLIQTADPWMQRATKHYPAGDARHGLDDARLFAYGNVTERFLDLRCLPLSILSPGCLAHGMGWGSWLQHSATLTKAQRTPTSSNTVQWEWLTWLTKPAQPMWVHGPVNIDASKIISTINEMADEPVVFIPKLFRPRGPLPPAQAQRLAQLASVETDCKVLSGVLMQ